MRANLWFKVIRKNFSLPKPRSRRTCFFPLFLWILVLLPPSLRIIQLPIMDLGSYFPFYGPRLCVLSPNHSGLPSIECQSPTDAPSMPSGFIIHILPWSHAYCYCYPTLIISHVFLLAHDALKYFLSILSRILMTKTLFRVLSLIYCKKRSCWWHSSEKTIHVVW